ncbi:MAG: CDP-2,3-bis-(O-geranylgeranyl)-sn-glycerol synthase [Candidatus Thermoplasmatota archaeon]|nr:CDP-2,3-bis-(O-geranylgeranyl)-sn-glycerol synthase [Candidatus Thermoplasmatota archaeon]MBU1941113.1 CDP-2,3-bis-(O-geranylgeranyl)-sn-glycerol synthase [Candidatus Thermoplasmatota archaeon]
MDTTLIIQAFWLVIPVYIANASAVIFGGGAPIDFHKTYRDEHRLLGDGKTWRGLISGTFIGMTAGFGLSVAGSLVNNSDYGYLHLTTYLGFPLMIPILLSLCAGALLGDIIESFFKRRIGKKRGDDWFGFDQLDFIVGALIFSFLMSTLLNVSGIVATNWFFDTVSIWHILILIIATPIIHITANFINNRIKTTHVKTYKT